MSDLVRINLFGTGCAVIRGVLDEALWKRVEETAARLGASVTLAPFDTEFISLLNDKKIKHLSDLGNEINLHGLLDHEKSRIEIRINAKKKRNIPFHEFGKDPGELFSKYSIKRELRNPPACPTHSIVLVQTGIGLIASYEFNPSRFDLDKLEFQVDEIPISETMNYSVLSGLSYEGKPLQKSGDDFLVAGMMGVVK